MNTKSKVLRLPALEIRQGRDRTLYSFAVDGKLLHEFAAISRIGRDEEKRVFGYQRPEVLSHIAEIRTYLESENPMVPNALVLAFDSSVTFEPGGRSPVEYSRCGTLCIPLTDEKPAWIVDGQQRAAAIREADVSNFPISIVGFVAEHDREQREQFILVNSTKPLPKGLVYELLPTTDARLPSMLQKRRFPTRLLDRLNLDADSPLRGLIRTPTVVTGLIKDNSLIKMLENSLTDGLLFRFRSDAADPDIDAIIRPVKDFWSAVSEVFQPAWALPPRRSRLMHGAGVVGLGFIMDAIAERHRKRGVPSYAQFRADIEPLKDVCRWTDGFWDFGPGRVRRWNELQNTPKDIQMLANFLLVQYKERVWNLSDGPNGKH